MTGPHACTRCTCVRTRSIPWFGCVCRCVRPGHLAPGFTAQSIPVWVACWLWAQWGPGASAATRPGATVRPGQTPAIMIGPTTGMHLSSTWPGVAAHRRGRGPVSAIFHYTQCSSACNKSNWGLSTVEIVSRASDRDAGGGGAAGVWAPPRRGRVPPPGTMFKHLYHIIFQEVGCYLTYDIS